MGMDINSLEDALKSIKNYSIRNVEFKGMPPIDWALWHANINSFRQSSPPKDDIAILRFALDQLNDGHSGILNKVSPAPSAQKKPISVGQMIGGMAYIRMAPCNLGDNEYAGITQNLIKELDRSRPDGWIVDLRINTGGDCYPMLEGIGPLLGNGTHAYLIYPLLDLVNPCSVDTPYRLNQPESPIAVLTGDHTVSSGELILISFLKLKNTKIFGEPSAGCSSSNVDFKFQDRVAAFTAGWMADCGKVPYGDKIHPDVLFTGGARPEDIKSENYNPAHDPLVLRASEWVHQATPARPSPVPVMPAPF